MFSHEVLPVNKLRWFTLHIRYILDDTYCKKFEFQSFWPRDHTTINLKAVSTFWNLCREPFMLWEPHIQPAHLASLLLSWFKGLWDGWPLVLSQLLLGSSFSRPGESIQWKSFILHFAIILSGCSICLTVPLNSHAQVNIFLGCPTGLFVSDFISILIFPSVSSQLPNNFIWQLVFPSFIQENLYSPECPSPSITDLHSLTQITPTSHCCTWLKHKFI